MLVAYRFLYRSPVAKSKSSIRVIYNWNEYLDAHGDVRPSTLLVEYSLPGLIWEGVFAAVDVRVSIDTLRLLLAKFNK